MVSINPSGIQSFKLSKEEHVALLQYCSDMIEDEALQKLFYATDGFLTLTKEQCAELRSIVDHKMNRIDSYPAIDLLGQIFNKLSPNPVTRQISRKLEGQEFNSPEELQAFADTLMHKQNNAPDPELGGLTPIQAHQLLYTDWDTPNCPMKLRSDLDFDDVKNTPLYHNSRTLLQALQDHKNTPTATAKGNLARKIVNLCVDKFKIHDDILNSVLATSKTLNESDVSVIWTTRLVCEMAGLIRKHKKQFRVTKKGKELLPEQNAGKLYHLLFMTYFRKYNIGFHDRLPELEGLQGTMIFPIYQIGQLAKKDTDINKISRKLVLPKVLDELQLFCTSYLKPETIIRFRVIEPLEYTGLLCCDRRKLKLFKEIVSLKIAPLYGKFIRFEWK